MSSNTNTVTKEKFDSLNEFLQGLQLEQSGSLGIDLLLGRSIGEDYEFGRIVIHEDIGEGLLDLMKTKVSQKREAIESGEIQLSEYSLENRGRDEPIIQFEDPNNIPQFEKFGRLLEGERFSHTDYTNSPKPNFQAVRIRDSSGDDFAIGFINYSRRQILGRKSWLRMKVNDETHSKVDESIMAIPSRIDAVYYDEDVYIFNQSKFEKMFDYLDEYENVADQVIDDIENSNIPFKDFDMFKEAVYGNNRVLRLMYKVHERGAYEDMDTSDAKYIRRNFNTDINFEENEDGEMAVKMDDKRDVWAVLRFFNDDHLDSPITEEQYISLSKEDAG